MYTFVSYLEHLYRFYHCHKLQSCYGVFSQYYLWMFGILDHKPCILVGHLVIKQESLAIAKMTARCALCIPTSYSPQFCSRLRSLYYARILILNEFKLRKFCLFLQDWRFGRSRSSEVIDFGAIGKRICDFLLVRKSNLGPILHHFGDMTAFTCCWPHGPHLFSTVILGVFPLHQIAHVGVSQRISPKLFGRKLFSKNSNLCEHGTGTWSALQTDRQTVRRYTVAIPRCA